jgi:hypothetical protein
MPKLVYGLFAHKMPKSVEKEKNLQNQIWFHPAQPLHSLWCAVMAGTRLLLQL